MQTLSIYPKYVLSVLTVLSVAAYSLPRPDKNDIPLASSGQQIIQLDKYIDANNVLMFVSNVGSFSYDRNSVFGKNDGFYYPYLGISNIQNGTATNTLCFAAGLWFAGVNSANGDTIISVSRYGSDFWPGPMAGGTYIPDTDTDSLYRVYKIYSDSLASNPNQDYLDWPSSQGAPVDSLGNPQLTGRQTLWSVYNDANSAVHINDASSAVGLGIEVQHTVWADTGEGTINLPTQTHFETTQLGSSGVVVTVEIVEANSITGDSYRISTVYGSIPDSVWHLINVTLNDTVLANQKINVSNTTVTDGFLVNVSNGKKPFEAFEVVANANGPLSPPKAGALGFQGFPSLNPDDSQQVGLGQWAIHTGDTQPNGTRGSYSSFLSRVFRSSNSFGANLSKLDLEWRFTGSNSNPGVGGGYAWDPFDQNLAIWVPFELWGIGVGTPNDASDDVRLIPWMVDNGRSGTFNLESWGDSASAPQGFVVGDPGTEHSASGGTNDPFTDWIYWYMPLNNSPGEAGYQEFEDSILIDAVNYSGPGTELLARIVLINWNGGTAPPFSQDLPEMGTIFRITTPKQPTNDSFTFVANPPLIGTVGAEDLSIYSKYKLINKSGNTYNGFFISLWFDPDLGNAGDDFVGCDTINDIFFCYNAGTDSEYGVLVPAFGGKLIEGPITPSIGDTAYVDGQPVPDYKNLGMYAFSKFIGGRNPAAPVMTYRAMNGLELFSGGPYSNGSRYEVPGDPVTGVGDIDQNSGDKRMFASFGPFDFAPNDTQQIVVKIGVGQGEDRLSSVTSLKEVLNFNVFEDTCCIGIRGDINGDGDDNSVLDLTYLIDYMFKGGPAAICPKEADLNNDGRSATILDLTFIIDDIFRGGPSPEGC